MSLFCVSYGHRTDSLSKKPGDPCPYPLSPPGGSCGAPLLAPPTAAAAVERHQARANNLAVLDKASPDLGTVAPTQPPVTLGAQVVALAEAQWELGVREPTGVGWREIDKYIRSAQGLGWSTADSKKWTPNKSYDQNDMFAWCGAFAAWCWGGVGLDATVRRKLMPSTVRLYGGYDDMKGWKKSSRYIPLADAQPGDIGVVTHKTSTAGKHIVIITRLDLQAGLIHTIEGNARGLGPDNTQYEGVVKRTRTLPKELGGAGIAPSVKCPVSGLPQNYTLLHVYRPLPIDITG